MSERLPVAVVNCWVQLSTALSLKVAWNKSKNAAHSTTHRNQSQLRRSWWPKGPNISLAHVAAATGQCTHPAASSSRTSPASLQPRSSSSAHLAPQQHHHQQQQHQEQGVQHKSPWQHWQQVSGAINADNSRIKGPGSSSSCNPSRC